MNPHTSPHSLLWRLRLTGTAALPTGSWVHVAVTRSGNTGTLYVNGVQAGQNTSMTLSPSSLGNASRNWIARPYG